MRQEYLADLASGGSLATLALLFPQTHLCKGGTSAKACHSLPIFPSLYRRTNSPSLATSFFSQGVCFLWGPHHGPCEVPVSARRGIEVRPTDPQNWKCTTFGLPSLRGAVWCLVRGYNKCRQAAITNCPLTLVRLIAGWASPSCNWLRLECNPYVTFLQVATMSLRARHAKITQLM